MNKRFIVIPSINANDNKATLVEWMVENREEVKKGEAIAAIETTKASIEIEAPVAGYCAHLFEEGDKITEGTIIAIILKSEDESMDPYLKTIKPAKEKSSKKWTKKAELMAEKLGVDIEKLAKELGRSVKEADILNYRKPEGEFKDLVDDQYAPSRRERVLLIGGGGGGGVLALDAIARTRHQRAVGILDGNKALYGKTVLGIPILGANSMAKKLWDEKYFDKAIILVTASIDERERLFHEIKDQDIPITNVIDPLTEIRTNCILGVGNLIMAKCFLAACVTLGDNNFLASHVCIEHHSVIGNHCTFGPRTTTSGAVTVGDGVKFGMGVLVEPYLTIGGNSVIPSGAVITASLPPKSLLKAKRNYTE